MKPTIFDPRLKFKPRLNFFKFGLRDHKLICSERSQLIPCSMAVWLKSLIFESSNDYLLLDFSNIFIIEHEKFSCCGYRIEHEKCSCCGYRIEILVVKCTVDIEFSSLWLSAYTYKKKGLAFLYVYSAENFRIVDIGINAWSSLFFNLQIKYCLFSSWI